MGKIWGFKPPIVDTEKLFMSQIAA